MGYYDDWKSNYKSLLSLIILLDQLPRNAYRGQKDAYLGNEYCIQLSTHGFKQFRKKYSSIELMFLLLPFQHSENIEHQKKGIQFLFYYMKNSKNMKSIKDLKLMNLTMIIILNIMKL